jgi:thermitase
LKNTAVAKPNSSLLINQFLELSCQGSEKYLGGTNNMSKHKTRFFNRNRRDIAAFLLLVCFGLAAERGMQTRFALLSSKPGSLASGSRTDDPFTNGPTGIVSTGAENDEASSRPKVNLASLVPRRGPAGEGSDEIPAGSRAYALIDNDCVLAREKAGAPIQFSDDMILISDAEPVESLKLQAFPIAVPAGTSASDWTRAADRDECLQRLEPDTKVEMIRPVSPPVIIPEDEPSKNSVRARAFQSNPTVASSFDASTSGTFLLDPVTDPKMIEQKYLNNIKAMDAWNIFFSPGLGLSPGRPALIAVLDSGVDYNHSEIRDHMWRDGQGRYGFDFENNDSDPFDDYYHGTFVSGIIAASSRNGVGISGVMLDHSRIMAVKVFDNQGSGYASSIANGIRYAVANGAKVINMSFGITGTSDVVRDALMFASQNGAVLIAASGNDGRLLNSSFIMPPAHYSAEVPGLIGVGSIDAVTSTKSSFTNYSTSLVQIAAPGSNGVISIMPGELYASDQGTSFATPMVSAAVAMILGISNANNLNLSNTDIKNIILNNSPTNAALTPYFQNGRQLDLYQIAKYVKDKYMISTDGGID